MPNCSASKGLPMYKKDVVMANILIVIIVYQLYKTNLNQFSLMLSFFAASIKSSVGKKDKGGCHPDHHP